MNTPNILLFWSEEPEYLHSDILELIKRCERDGEVIEPWRCHASLKAVSGSRAYLFCQEKAHRGFFGIGSVVGARIRNTKARKGIGKWMVPVKFTILVDPRKQPLVGAHMLSDLTPPPRLLTYQASGVTLEPHVAERVDAILAAEQDSRSPDHGKPAASDPEATERLNEVYQRDQRLVRQLKAIYNGCCQICESPPFNRMFGDLSEGHHIQWLCRGGPDEIDNMMLLCPNHHAAVHTADPTFDWNRLEFRFPTRTIPVRNTGHLATSRFRKLSQSGR